MTPKAGVIRLLEVGPRDGLQSEPRSVPTAVKIAFIDALSLTGLKEIEAGAFVSPRAIPQLADSDEVFAGIRRNPDVTYSALVPNEAGLERALKAGVDKIAVFTAASEAFNRRNINASIAESLARYKPVLARAERANLPVRGYVLTAFHCPYEGRIAPEKVLPVLLDLLELGVEEVSIGDTIGKAVPREVRRLLDLVLKKIPKGKVFMHFHDTYGTAVANALAAWEEYGITGFDASTGGVGGCPYAPGTLGNAATEDLLNALRASGATVPADTKAIIEAARLIAPHIGRPLASRLSAVLRT